MNLLVILHGFPVADGEDNENARAEAHLPMFLYSSKRILSKIMVLAGFGLLEDH